jgi:hypothetical protein
MFALLVRLEPVLPGSVRLRKATAVGNVLSERYTGL